MQALARMTSGVSATPPARRRLIRVVLLIDKMPFPLVILAALIFYVPHALVSASADSDGTATYFVLIFVGFPAIIALWFWSSFATASAVRQGRISPRRVGVLLGAVMLLSLSVAAVRWSLLHPKQISYEFSYGQSGSWHEVQFRSIDRGETIKGPWVGGYPLRVSFPDLNSDGHRDIRVRGSDRLTEYEYLPDSDGPSHWHLVRNEGFKVSYPPDGHRYP